MWVYADANGDIARDGEGKPILVENKTPLSFIDPAVTPKKRRTDTGARDEVVVHFTGRSGPSNSALPSSLQNSTAPKRLFRILKLQALLALEPFGRSWVYPSVCFCEGNQTARANLMKDGRYSRYGLAFHRDFVEQWGARPVIYADADVIGFLYQALWAYWWDHRPDMTETETRRLNVVRSLMVRDWPGAEESQQFFEEHCLDFDVKNTNEWSHEHEMRLILPESSGWGPVSFYWRFEPESVSHLLWPTSGDVQEFAESVAADSEAQWAIDTEVKLIGTDGFPREVAPLRSYLR